jgi:HK97 family phage major capsid protein
MELKEMTIEQLEERKAAIAVEVDAPEADLDALEAEARSIKEELEARAAIEAEKAEIRAAVAEGAGTVVTEFEEIEERKEEKEMFGIDTVEYRNAFFANLVDMATAEQRAILADNTTYGDGLALPVGVDREVWDQVSTAHPILADVDVLRAGMAIKVTKMTPSAVSKKKDSDPSVAQTFTGVDVVLVGADYHTYVELSYAEAKMSQGAMERFLIKEIANAIGEALAADVFARILSDAGTGQKVTSTSDIFADLKSALGLATQAGRAVVYAPASAYYGIIGAVNQGSPFNAAAQLGCEVKLDNAATKVTVVDPSMFVLDIIQDTIIESDRDAKNAQFVIGGYMRAEGCLRKATAAAYID